MSKMTLQIASVTETYQGWKKKDIVKDNMRCH